MPDVHATPKARRLGFTLVEMMIVVAIIGLLATLAIPLYAKARQTSITERCIQNMRSVYDGVTRYEMDNNRTLYSIRSNGATIRNTLIAGGYVSYEMNFDCPASPLKDFDDYLLIYSNGTDLSTVQCSIKPTLHLLP